MRLDSSRYTAAIACMSRPFFLDEFEEWIEWHAFIGFEHFFIYDDSENRILTETFGCDPRITFCNFVDHSPRNGTLDLHQTEILSRIMDSIGNCTDWLALIDDDEFVIAPENNLHQILNDLKARDEKGLEIFLKTFGTSDHESKPPGLVLENYLHQSHRFLTKTICNPAAAISAKRLNSLLYRDGYQPLYINGQRRVEPVTSKDLRERMEKPPFGNLWLNHYVTKSDEHFQMKKDRGCMTKPIKGKTPAGLPVFDSKWTETKPRRFSKNGPGMTFFDWKTDGGNLLDNFKRWLHGRQADFTNGN
mgnify:CR=1 FL=1